MLLPHAVSRCLVGHELYYDALRFDLFFGELQQHAAWYKQVLNTDAEGNAVYDDDEWQKVEWKRLLTVPLQCPLAIRTPRDDDDDDVGDRQETTTVMAQHPISQRKMHLLLPPPCDSTSTTSGTRQPPLRTFIPLGPNW